MYHSHSKHIEVRYHWLRVLVEQQSFELEKIHTDWNPADMLTKVVSREMLKLCARLINVNSNWRLGLKISSVVGGICWVQSTVWVQPTWLVKAHLWACLQKSSSQPFANHVSEWDLTLSMLDTLRRKEGKERKAIRSLCAIGRDKHWVRVEVECVSYTEWARNTERYSAICGAVQRKK